MAEYVVKDNKSLENIINIVYPIGSIYFSINSVSPQTLFGGTWEQIEDRFLLASGSHYTAGSTGGEATHVLSAEEMPKHGGHLKQGGWAGTGSYYFDTAKALGNFTAGAYGWQVEQGNEIRPYREYAGSSAAHNNMPPYLAVYVWKRTA